ncbi:MAG: DUF6465 family protein [Butyrivibrio sp.]|nr:DUF6465 family protein [Butyrivibrio sp.]
MDDKIKEIANEVKKKAEPYLEDIRTKAEPVIDDIKTKAEPVLEEAKKAKKAADPYINDIKTKAEPVISKAKKSRAASTAQKVKKDITEKAGVYICKEEVYVQYNSHELRTTDIIGRAKEDYISKGHKRSDIKEIQVYIKPSDNAAYYVVNSKDTGKIGF